MKTWLVVIVACLALGVVVAGCGGDDNDSGGSEPAKTSESQGSGGAAAPAKGGGTEVDMKDISFQPDSVTIKKGQTVTWKNEDSVGHDVTADDGSFKSGDAGGITGGQTYKHSFDKAGSFTYVCTVHPGMEGTVVVK